MNQDIFNPTRVTATVGGKEIIFETGRLANQAHGAVWVQCGGTVVLVTVCSQALEFDKGFFPLTVEYSEKMYAAGRIPGSFFRREIGRPSERETLVSRLIDRPIRPLFPKGLNEDVQVLASVISADQENESDVLALTGASAAVMLSPLPFEGPVAGGRIGRIDGQFVLNPTFEEQERSDLNIVFAASRDALTMVEGRSHLRARRRHNRRAGMGPQGDPAAHRRPAQAARTGRQGKDALHPPSGRSGAVARVQELPARPASKKPCACPKSWPARTPARPSRTRSWKPCSMTPPGPRAKP